MDTKKDNKNFEEEDDSWWEEESPYEKIHKPIICSEKFTKFLIENGAYEKFVKASSPYCYKIKVSFNIIGSFFVWSDTEEGYDFWNELNDRWEYNYWQLI